MWLKASATTHSATTEAVRAPDTATPEENAILTPECSITALASTIRNWVDSSQRIRLALKVRMSTFMHTSEMIRQTTRMHPALKGLITLYFPASRRHRSLLIPFAYQTSFPC